MRILITGATGLLGNNLTRLAIAQGHQVIAVGRDRQLPASLAELPVDYRHADLTDAASMRSAAEGADGLIHSAAVIHLGWTRMEESIAFNRGSTIAAADAAMARGIPMTLVSTVNCLAIPMPKSVADETTPWDGQVPCAYVISKRAADQAMIDAVQRGLYGTIVHPGFMLGPWDWKPSSGRMILELHRRWTPVAPAGGCSVCDVRDVADGTLRALLLGQSGRRYILCGENMTYFQLWSAIAKAIGKPAPWTILRKPGQWLVGRAGDLAAKITGQETDINSAALQMSGQYHWYSSQRAEEELGYQHRPASVAIGEAVEWFRRQGRLS
jgi:dihydroflavonol-4-reductase